MLHRHRAQAIVAEFQFLGTNEQPPVTADLVDLHLALLPGPLVEATPQRDQQGCRHSWDVDNREQPENLQTGYEDRSKGRQHGPAGGGAVSKLLSREPCDGMAWQDLTKARTTVPLYNARVQISLRPSVLDPAGEATRAAATRLGVTGIKRLRIGKAIELELEAADRATAEAQVTLLSDRLLANPVIEDWSLELAELN